MDNTMEEYSSGCESGWTVYFEQSRGYEDDQGCVNRSEEVDEADEEEEDLSMVSDASSGPVQISPDNDTNSNCYINEGRFYSVSKDEDAALVRSNQPSKKPRTWEKRVDYHHQNHMLDDTASSRLDFNYSSLKNGGQTASSIRQMIDFSQDHLSTSYIHDVDASSSAIHCYHYDQAVRFHQQYNWH